jgi:hypothetical protein
LGVGRSETSNCLFWKLETGNWKLSLFWKLETLSVLETGNWKFEHGI